MTLIIDPSIREQADIRRTLEDYVNAQPDTARWSDFYAGGAGQTAIDLVAAIGAFDAFNSAMVQREGARSKAVLPSSIRDHAFNSGILEGPTSTLELLYEYQVNSGTTVTIGEGDLVARLGTYEVYSLENKDVSSDFTLRVAVGILNTVTKTISGDPYDVWNFDLELPFVSPSLELLTVNGFEVALRSDPGDLSERGNNFVLRQASSNEVNLFSGNGILGFNDPAATSLTYRYLNYGEDLATVIDLIPQSLLSSGVRLIRQTVLQKPVYGISSNELRGLMMYYPVDGRIVQDRDYEGVIMRSFGGVLFDAFSWNTDPDQVVRLLVSSDFDEDIHLPQIQTLVDGKRGDGIHVTYETVTVADGQTVVLDFSVPRDSYQTYLAKRDAIFDYLAQRTNQFVRGPAAQTIKTQDLAVDMSTLFGIKFYSVTDNEYVVEPGEFVTAYDLQVNPTLRSA